MKSVTCPDCEQFPVAMDHLGICPHLFRGQPCPGGRREPKLLPAVERSPAAKTARALAGQAKRNAGMAARRSRRDEAVRKLLPAPTMDIARALNISTDSARLSCLRLGAVLDAGEPTACGRVWRLAALAQAAK